MTVAAVRSSNCLVTIMQQWIQNPLQLWLKTSGITLAITVAIRTASLRSTTSTICTKQSLAVHLIRAATVRGSTVAGHTTRPPPKPGGTAAEVSFGAGIHCADIDSSLCHFFTSSLPYPRAGSGSNRSIACCFSGAVAGDRTAGTIFRRSRQAPRFHHAWEAQQDTSALVLTVGIIAAHVGL